MLENIFINVLNMSYTATFVILIVIGVRFILKKFPKIYSYLLWFVVLYRLLIPFSFEGSTSLLPVKPKPIVEDIGYMAVPKIDSGIEVINDTVNASLPQATEIASVNPLQVWIYIGSIIWLVGALALVIYNFISYQKLKKRVRGAVETDGIYVSDNIDTAFVMGLINRKIYLPANVNEEEKRFILLHEMNHIKRYDNFTRLLSFIALCIHWFNPLVWIAFHLSGKDMEMSCDEAVILKLGSDTKKDYSKSLLNLSTRDKMSLYAPITFSENNIKKRVENVLNFKSPKFWLGIMVSVVVVSVSVSLFLNPKDENSIVEAGFEHTLYETLYEKRVEFVGDNSAVGALMNTIITPDKLKYSHIKLQTGKLPFEMEVVYKPLDGEISEDLSKYKKMETDIRRNSFLMLALIDNVAIIHTRVSDGERELYYSVGERYADAVLGEPVKVLGKTQEGIKRILEAKVEIPNDIGFYITKVNEDGSRKTVCAKFLVSEIEREYLSGTTYGNMGMEKKDEQVYYIIESDRSIHTDSDIEVYTNEHGKVVMRGDNGKKYTILTDELFKQLEAEFE